MYRCPTCQSSDHLEVVITAWALLVQDDDDDIQTDLDLAEDRSHEWDNNSSMRCMNEDCRDYGDTNIADYFEVTAQCGACGDIVSSLVSCPDGAEVCRECFEQGAH